MATNKIYVFDIFWSMKHIVMHVYDDINVAAVHESEGKVKVYFDDIFGYNIDLELQNVDPYILVFVA